ncbi:MAG: EamA family transporter [Leptolyngbyaceae cyanobacterium CSU_1_3]|nr:EamA family transporter [Leptolyngbyaceae cyanobacterium CSU_1_3]
MNRKEWLLLVILSVLWGGSFFFIKVAVQDLPPLTIVWGRVGVAAIVLTLFVYWMGQKLPTSPKLWVSLTTMGVLSNLIPFSLIVWGETQISSGLASILNATTPIFTVILAHFLTAERLTRNRLLGIVFGFGGVIVLFGSHLSQGLHLPQLGQLAVLGAAFAYGLSGLYGRRFDGLPAAVTAAGMLICTTIVTSPLVLLFDQPWTLRPRLTTWAALLALGLLSTAIAYLIYFHLLSIVGATNVSLVTFLIPISALFLGVLVLHEQLTWNALVGMGLIFVGLAVINGGLFQKRDG